MRFSFLSSLLLVGASAVSAASSWGFDEATLTVTSKGSGVGSGLKEKFGPKSPLEKPVELGPSDTLKLVLTTLDGKKAQRPHQAFLTLTEPTTGLEDSFALSVKDNGKGKVELTQKDLPVQFLTTTSPVKAYLVIASFGSSTPYKSAVFDLDVQRDPNTPLAIPEPPVRYGKKAEIHHIFKPDPTNPPKVITLVFTAAVVAALPVLFGAWAVLGANISHAPKAFGAAPVSHGLFFGSIVALEGIFFLYYTAWNLFQTLPAAAAVGLVAYISGSRALSEVQERRLAGQR
ncbi:putative oligosaccharyltransferase subunit ribophorin ii protein [Lasiodiplodia theobromae]|uniref:Dolichyl-diphosphooligosaccharide--protein glycosyltransferase subunit 2 n=1 Tax=Lasiodiplodia theobromae TaxID=45133 RepID=A0A5N5CYY5_9PEZI|nr:Oligosaccharyltransferase subunit ribophorin ii [Lasiodiplodia theobromae]KAB2570547.1 Dolichyl-diphosphooligosaccharide--protein glycosyltransferase subunit 2 [Lasiodiplodia theobromae]KAF4541735.1 Oligosaccharyltransferase subunit ribophorin ii [Lasiodiplodia theobromae]KAF9629749.1 putative oligosaccharyltransferase subunit ribophorin ii protein [Lasiodiplodia theobromae]